MARTFTWWLPSAVSALPAWSKLPLGDAGSIDVTLVVRPDARVDKVEYDWSTEFADPPKWMRDPLPWDWLFVVERR